MTWIIQAIYENGILRPLQALQGMPDRSRVDVTVTTAEPASPGGLAIAPCIGTIPDADAAEMSRIIEEEFERVDAHDW